MSATFDIDALRAAVVGADLGSFSRAAVELGRSQSAISMQLKKLEQQADAQLFVRRGRGLVPTEAGEALLAYARRIVALNDEAAIALGVASSASVVRLGLPQDFCEEVVPATLAAFSERHPRVRVDVRAGDNHKHSSEIEAGRLDGAVTFFDEGARDEGELLLTTPMRWLAHTSYRGWHGSDEVPLVLFDHPCLFRKAALSAFDRSASRWRAAVTTPSLHYVWAALRSRLGIGVRTEYGLPKDITSFGQGDGLPELPRAELRLLRAQNPSRAAEDLCEILKCETIRLIARR